MERAREFAQVVVRAGASVEKNLNAEPGSLNRNRAVEIANEFRQIAGDLEKTLTIDERSSDIRTRLIGLLKNRATAFDQAVNDSLIAAAVSADRQAFTAVFNDYSDWEDDALEEFRTLFEQ